MGPSPWAWTAPEVDEFFMELQAVRGASHTTLLGYQNSLRLFMGYVTMSVNIVLRPVRSCFSIASRDARSLTCPVAPRQSIE